MYGTCVGLIGIDPRYYLDEMSYDEVVAVMKSWHGGVSERWEQVRLQCYYGGFTGAKKPQDLFKFPWEKRDKKTEPVSKEEAMKRYQQMRKKR